MSAVAELAEAVKDALNGAPDGTFGEAFTASRLYLPRVELEQMGSGLSVKVVPRGDDRALQSRGGSVSRDVQIDIGVQKKLAAGTNPDEAGANSQIDDLLTLVEEIADFLKPGTAYTVGGRRAIAYRTTIDPFYVPEHLAQYSVFTSVVTVVLRLN